MSNHEFWSKVFKIFNLETDPNLSRHLKKKDENKSKRQIVQGTKSYKAYRSSNHYDEYSEAHAYQLDETKTSAQYETGFAVKVAKKSLKAAPKCNPPGTLIGEWKYLYYHPNY